LLNLGNFSIMFALALVYLEDNEARSAEEECSNACPNADDSG
jgi:hypothetical protein